MKVKQTKKILGKKASKDYDWQVEAESYFSALPSPKRWFEFLEWVVAIATLSFLYELTGSVLIRIIYFISFAVLSNYVQKVLYTTKFQNYRPFNSLKINKKLLSYLISVVLITFYFFFVGALVGDLEKALKQGNL